VISLPAEFEREEITSRWTSAGHGSEVALAIKDIDPHDLALELLLCVGQLLWEAVDVSWCADWRRLLCVELSEEVQGEIDEQALEAKQRLLASRAVAQTRRCWEDYTAASFAGSVAEYVHCLWHDVTVRTGAAYLPAASLRRRLSQLAAWFPPNHRQRLFAAHPMPAP
jgi:hypothetical protein